MSKCVRTRQPKSLVLLNTGAGKGKSTAAFGVVMRALAQGWRVGVIQFLKSDRWHTGEESMFRALGVEWIKGGQGFTWEDPGDGGAEHKAQETWKTAARALECGEFDLLVLDEITLALSLGWLDENEVVERIRTRATATNVILTGRDAPASLVSLADTVTEMRNIRHPFDEGVLARPGIDY